MIKLKDLKPNQKNPRFIRDSKFIQLKESIDGFPKGLKYRPIIVNEDNVIIGGNMRHKALVELGYKEIPEEWVMMEDEFTEEERRRFVIVDNLGFGEWDYDMLGNEWDTEELGTWGMDVWQPQEEDSFEPNFNPESTYSDVTAEEIEKQAQKLAIQMLKEKQGKDVICPSCLHEFQLHE